MNREESLKLARYEETPYYFQRLINKIYDDFEKDLKDINNQVSRLKKQLSKDHHIECGCSFCKPLACSYVVNNNSSEMW